MLRAQGETLLMECTLLLPASGLRTWLPNLAFSSGLRETTSKLLRKVYSTAQSSFILNPQSDYNKARNICHQRTEWVENGFAELLLDYLIFTSDTYA